MMVVVFALDFNSASSLKHEQSTCRLHSGPIIMTASHSFTLPCVYRGSSQGKFNSLNSHERGINLRPTADEHLITITEGL